MKQIISSMIFMGLATVAHSATFALTSLDLAQGTGSGTIQDAGVAVGTFSFTSNGTQGFLNNGNILQNSGVTDGANGLQLAYANDGAGDATTPDIIDLQFTITAEAGFELDTLTISQTNYTSNTNGTNGGNNGGSVGDAAPVYSVEGYTGGFTADQGSANPDPSGASATQITAPAVVSGNLDFEITDGFLSNSEDDWSVTLLDPTATTTITQTTPNNVFVDWISLDATFTAVPEPSSTMMLLLGAFGMTVVRRRK